MWKQIYSCPKLWSLHQWCHTNQRVECGACPGNSTLLIVLSTLLCQQCHITWTVVYCGNSSLAPVISSNISGVKLHGRLDVIGVAAALLRFVLWTLNQWYCIAWKSEPCPNEMVEILIKPTSMAHNATYRMFLPHVQSFQFLEGLLLWSTWWSVTYATVRLTGIFLWAVLTSLKSQ